MSQKSCVILVWLVSAIAILPAVFQWPVPEAATPTTLAFISKFRYVLALGICYLIYRAERKRVPQLQALILAYVVLMLTLVVNNVHYNYVDIGRPYFPTETNLQWQTSMQQYIMRLAPEVIPHSYRFLPNSIVRWMELTGIDFELARDIYRLIFGLLLFYALYKFARLYTNYVGGIFAMFLAAAVFPVSFEHYAGQLTDPLSHLSFLLAFIFLEIGAFPALLATLVIGSLAKETVLALAGYYVLFCRGEQNYRLKSAVLCIASVVSYFGIRMLVVKGQLNYTQISGVSLSHVQDNLNLPNGLTSFATVVCAFLPFLYWGWKRPARSPKVMALFLLPVLFISSLFFSWLQEARNFMPLVFVLSVIAAQYLIETIEAKPLSRNFGPKAAAKGR